MNAALLDCLRKAASITPERLEDIDNARLKNMRELVSRLKKPEANAADAFALWLYYGCGASEDISHALDEIMDEHNRKANRIDEIAERMLSDLKALR